MTNRNKPLTEAEGARIVALVGTMGMRKIAAKVGVSRTSVANHLIRLGLWERKPVAHSVKPPVRATVRLTEAEKARIVELARGRMSPRQIAAHVGCSRSTAEDFLISKGLYERCSPAPPEPPPAPVKPLWEPEAPSLGIHTVRWTTGIGGEPIAPVSLARVSMCGGGR